eukprot:5304392-Heterocapsa_arctica.AAC.1
MASVGAFASTDVSPSRPGTVAPAVPPPMASAGAFATTDVFSHSLGDTMVNSGPRLSQRKVIKMRIVFV